MHNITCNDYPVTGSTLQAYGSGSGQLLAGKAEDEDIVWSTWKHVAVYFEESKRAKVLRLLLNISDKALPIGGAKAFLTNQRVMNPHDIFQYYQQLEASEKCDGVILDTLTHLMASYERKVVDVSTEGFGAWKDYGNFYKGLNDLIKSSDKTHIVMAHTDTELVGMDMISKILVKGAVGKIGVNISAAS